MRLEELDSRAVTVLRKVFNAGDDLEMHLRNMEIDNKLQLSYFLGKVGISMSLENLIRGDFSRYQGLFCILYAGLTENPSEYTAEIQIPVQTV